MKATPAPEFDARHRSQLEPGSASTRSSVKQVPRSRLPSGLQRDFFWHHGPQYKMGYERLPLSDDEVPMAWRSR